MVFPTMNTGQPKTWHRSLLALSVLGVALCLAGCNVLKMFAGLPETKQQRELAQNTPGSHSFRLGQFVIISDFEIKPEQPIFKELAKLGEEVTKDLQLPTSSSLVQVHIFEDKEKYQRYMRAKNPRLPDRPAFFLVESKPFGGGDEYLIFTYWGEHIREDLRHELTHALLHGVLKAVPLWLDEGLAEYYELPPGKQGVSVHHLDNLRRHKEKSFNLARLETLAEVSDMSTLEYSETWAWVHFMLHGKPEAKAVLLAYLQMLRSDANPGVLRPRLVSVLPNLDVELAEHLKKLETGRGSKTPSK